MPGRPAAGGPARRIDPSARGAKATWGLSLKPAGNRQEYQPEDGPMMKSFEDLPLDLMRQVDAVCDRFEASLQAGAAPRIDVYLELMPATVRLVLIGELLALAGWSGGSPAVQKTGTRRARPGTLF
jgi:hypothetical protein